MASSDSSEALKNIGSEAFCHTSDAKSEAEHKKWQESKQYLQLSSVGEVADQNFSMMNTDKEQQATPVFHSIWSIETLMSLSVPYGEWVLSSRLILPNNTLPRNAVMSHLW